MKPIDRSPAPGPELDAVRPDTAAAASVDNKVSVHAVPRPDSLDDKALKRLLTTTNVGVQQAWAVREKLLELLPAAAGDTAARLRAVLGDMRTGRTPPAAANRALAALIKSATGEQWTISAEVAAQRILSMPVAELEAILPQENAAPVASTKTSLPASPALALGRTALASLMLTDDTSKLRQLVLSLPCAAPASALGRLAHALGVETAEALLRGVQGMDDTQLSLVRVYLASQAEARSILRGLGAQRAGPLTPGEPGHGASDGASEQRQRLVGYLGALGVDSATATAALQQQQKSANKIVAELVARVEALSGAPLSIDAQAASLRLTERKSGAALKLALAPAAEEQDALYHELLTQAVVPYCNVLAQGAGIALPEATPRVAQALVLACARRAVPEAAHETRTAYVARLLRMLVDPRELQTAVARSRDERGHDGAAFDADLLDYASELTNIEQDMLATSAAHAQRHNELQNDILSLPPDVARALRAHTAECLPYEAMAWLATDGEAVYLLPLRNMLAGTEAGKTEGRADPRDLAAAAEWLQRAELGLLAAAHSHPGQSPLFSDGDLQDMRSVVAREPSLRTLIVGTSFKDGRLVQRMACFSSDIDGQVLGEDTIELR